MSGTSMDGVDTAEIMTDGLTIFALGEGKGHSFTQSERRILLNALGKWPGEKGVDEAARIIDDVHIHLIKQFKRAKLVGFHGQTLIHDPVNQRTHQAGNGVNIANKVGLPVIWNFREQDMMNGGQGAPLVPFFHFALSQFLGFDDLTAFINIGGIANITLVEPGCQYPESGGVIAAFDSGPGNCLMDQYCQTYGNSNYDTNGHWSRNGTCDHTIVDQFMAHEYFCKIPPKSADRLDFNFLLEQVRKLSFVDGLATLTECTALSISRAVRSFPSMPKRVGICGGGACNGYLMERIRELSGVEIARVDAWQLDSKYLEAQAFGYLAARSVNNLPLTSPATTGCRTPTTGGTLSIPHSRDRSGKPDH